jgi:Glycosyl transferases group 1
VNGDLTGSAGSPKSSGLPSLLVPSNRSTYRLVSYGTVVDFEDAICALADADLVEAPGYSRRARIRAALRPADKTFRPVIPPRDEYDLCFFVAMNPGWISSLRYIDRLRERCKRIVVYVFDTWQGDAAWLRRNRREWALCDLVYVSFPWAVDTFSRHLRCAVEYLPQAASAARFYPWRENRPIEILSVGRRLRPAHLLIRDIAKRHDLFYHYSESEAPDAIDLVESRELLARLCQSARSQICWPVEETNPNRRGEGSPVTSRWFEAAACGSVVLGRPPRARDFQDLFPYERFVVELDPRDPREFERRLLAALDDEVDWSARRDLAEFIRARHSWEARSERIIGEAS